MKGCFKQVLAQAPDDNGVAFIDVIGVIGDEYDEMYSRYEFEEEKALTLQNLRRELNKTEGATSIVVNIASPGGSYFEGLAMHDFLVNHPATVTTRVIGSSASAATIIAQAGDKREVSENALTLIHNTRFMFLGALTKEYAESLRSELEVFDENMAQLYSKRTGKSVEDIKAQMNKNEGEGEWMTASQAIDFGLADSIVEAEMKVAAQVTPEQIKALNLPALPNSEPVAQAAQLNKTDSKMSETKKGIFAYIAEKLGRETSADEKPEILAQAVEQLTDELKTANDSIEAMKAELEAVKADLATAKEAEAEAKAKAEATAIEAAKGAGLEAEGEQSEPVKAEYIPFAETQAKHINK